MIGSPDIRAPFAVSLVQVLRVDHLRCLRPKIKSGSHNTNPGHSSTSGVQISMAGFKHIEYDADSRTVRLGPGLRWEEVYAALEPYGVNVVGARENGIGKS